MEQITQFVGDDVLRKQREVFERVSGKIQCKVGDRLTPRMLRPLHQGH